MTTEIVKINEEVANTLANPQVVASLLQTTFKGLNVENAKKAMIEGRIRGFEIRDFLEKNIYAIPYGSTYSLVTSIDHARKVGMRSGVCGKSAPVYEEDEKGGIVSCTITIKRNVAGVVGDYSAKVYFKEFSTGKNLWATKPRVMIAKVAEMHALRMACPEEMSEVYTEEEFEKQATPESTTALDLTSIEQKLRATKTLPELQSVWGSLPGEAKKPLEAVKDELKKAYAAA